MNTVVREVAQSVVLKLVEEGLIMGSWGPKDLTSTHRTHIENMNVGRRRLVGPRLTGQPGQSTSQLPGQ